MGPKPDRPDPTPISPPEPSLVERQPDVGMPRHTDIVHDLPQNPRFHPVPPIRYWACTGSRPCPDVA